MQKVHHVPFWERLETKARALGFTDISCSPVVPLSEDADLLEDWLEKGFEGSMEYMKKTKEVRKNPELFLEGAQSVLVCTVNYYRAQHPRIASLAAPSDRGGLDQPSLPERVSGECRRGVLPPTGTVARYARGRDYHKVIKKMLQSLISYLQTELIPESTEKDYRLSLDAHPVLERAWAKKAKVGFIGKNSCLITRSAGSWVLLGSIVTTLKIPAKPENKSELSSSPLPNPPPRGEGMKKGELDFSKLSCGKCTKCIDICPTRAIVKSGVIDARKCISYLTIESKGSIPLELREKMGDHLFGCDLCQEVCPFNTRREHEQENPLTQTFLKDPITTVAELLQIRTDQEFEKRFAGTPIMRAKRMGMLRNACVVAGNLKDVSFLPMLEHLVAHEANEMVVEHAQWAITRIQQTNRENS